VNPTGSKIHRVWKCPASVVLPQNVDDDREERNEPARNRGRHIHEFLENVKAKGRTEALASIADDDVRSICAALDLDKMPVHLATEVAYAYNWRTGTARELGRNLGHRNYDDLGVDWSCEIPCTLDIVGEGRFMLHGSEVHRGYCGDYKTGHTRYPRPGEFGQTLLGALCLRSVMGVDDVTVELIYIDEYGESYPVRDTVDAWQLSVFEEELRIAMDSLIGLGAAYARGIEIPKHEGSHCDYCPAFKNCSAKVALVKALPAELIALTITPERTNGDGSLDYAPGFVTVRNAGMVYEACERIEEVCRRMRSEVCGLAWSEPIELSDGRIIERYETRRRSVEGKVVAKVLEERYGREAALEAITIESSIDAIKRVASAHKQKGEKLETKKGDGVVDQILAELDRRKGLILKVGEECKPHQPKKKKPVFGS
jgi:hypothetical protein